MPFLAYLHAVLGVLDLGVFTLLVIMWCNMVVVASCEQQHKKLIVAWELYHFPLAFVCYCCRFSRYVNKNYCHVLSVVIVVLQAILSLVLCAFTIVDVVDPHQFKRLVVTCAILCARLNQP
jgi:hypothetical protein